MHRTQPWWHQGYLLAQYAMMSLFKYIMMPYFSTGSDVFGSHVVHVNGEEISQQDMNHFRRVMARNTIVERWQKFDVVFLDNNRIAHGRHSFFGERSVLTTWTEDTEAASTYLAV